MNAPRFDMYTLVHKGQRKRLFELTVAAGQLGPDDAAGRVALAADVRALLSALVEHAEAEEAHFGPLYATSSPATGTRLAAEHRAFEADHAAVCAALDAAVEHPSRAADLALYRALARFAATYLLHIDHEEGSMPELWAAHDDAALARAQGALVAAHSPTTVQFNLRSMLPAASSAERVAFLAGLKRNMPAPAFAGVRNLVGALVTAAEWSLVEAA